MDVLRRLLSSRCKRCSCRKRNVAETGSLAAVRLSSPHAFWKPYTKLSLRLVDPKLYNGAHDFPLLRCPKAFVFNSGLLSCAARRTVAFCESLAAELFRCAFVSTLPRFALRFTIGIEERDWRLLPTASDLCLFIYICRCLIAAVGIAQKYAVSELRFAAKQSLPVVPAPFSTVRRRRHHPRAVFAENNAALSAFALTAPSGRYCNTRAIAPT